MAELLIGLGDKPMGKKKPESSSPDLGEESSSFETSLDEAVDAIVSGDKETAKAALKAAITAHCADVYSEME